MYETGRCKWTQLKPEKLEQILIAKRRKREVANFRVIRADGKKNNARDRHGGMHRERKGIRCLIRTQNGDLAVDIVKRVQPSKNI